MEFYELSETENTVFNGLINQMKTLNKQSQYKVLKKLAHVMDRQIVRPGAVRAAAASATAAVGARIGSKNAKSSSNPNPKTSKREDLVAKDWAESSEGKFLIEDRESFKKTIDQKNPTAEQREVLSKKSAALRQSLQLFRIAAKNSPDHKYPEEIGKANQTSGNKDPKGPSASSKKTQSQEAGATPTKNGKPEGITSGQTGGSAKIALSSTSTKGI
jgi:hypothetical protein